MDITTIPEEELRKDLKDSRNDNAMCEIAILLGIASYNDNSTEERVRTNMKIIMVIEAELARREKAACR